ncbi:MAG: hypothetical protein HY800_10005, partial [Ignavibacteriales bacterium]|nr:hypothetical protein [Ignavibacteriales bacterium]
KPPATFLWLYPDSTLAEGTSKQHIRWWGEDPDGIIKGYLFAFDTVKFYDSSGVDTIPVGWRWKKSNDTIVTFPLLKKRQIFYVAVRAVDNTFPHEIDDNALIHNWNSTTYWDKNENNIFDSDDIEFQFQTNSFDRTAATLDMPTLNQPPSVTFAFNPNNPTVTMQQPETTFTVATFAWEGTDPDGDKTIAQYEIALNDTSDSTRWFIIPSNKLMITLVVPRERSLNVVGEVDADLYVGTYLTQNKLPGVIKGLKLDSLNIFYLRARDIAGDASSIIAMPDIDQPSSKGWYVKNPRGKLLIINDFLNNVSGNRVEVLSLYQKIFRNGIDGKFADFEAIDIARGLTIQNKKDNMVGVMVPPFIDPAFLFTLQLFDVVFWYTDQNPSLGVAQLPLFYYVRDVSHRGKVIFSTMFENSIDPRGALKDFAPIDSLCSIDLLTTDPYTGTRLLPAFGDNKIKQEYLVLPEQSSSFPVLKFNIKTDPNAVHSVYMRPIYRRADARYIYHIQEDVRTAPVHYTYTPTLGELKTITSISGSATTCGVNGLILNSLDGGSTWIKQKSGTTNTLNATKFIDALHGWIVGDMGTILQTNDGGISWNNQSVLTFENLLAVDFISDTFGCVVGTKGIIITTSNGGVKWESKLLKSKSQKTLRAVQFYNENTGIAVGENIIWRTSNSGNNWDSVYGSKIFNSVRFVNDSKIFVVGNSGTLLQSTDSGITWTLRSGLSGDLRSIYFNDELNGWICGKYGGLYKTVHGGQTWNTIPSPGTNVTQNLNAVSFINPNDGWSVGTGGIIIRTTDGGVNWYTQPQGNINIGVIDGTNSFVFIGLPLHLLNGDVISFGDGTYLETFFKHVLLEEFGL